MNIKKNYENLPWRELDPKAYIADISKANKDFGWKPKVNKSKGLRSMYSWVEKIKSEC